MMVIKLTTIMARTVIWFLMPMMMVMLMAMAMNMMIGQCQRR